MKAFEVHVYRTALGDCTLGGVSSKESTLFVAHADGYLEIAEHDPRLFKPEERLPGYVALRPVQDGDSKGPFMAGGNVALPGGATTEQRAAAARALGPVLHVHDRQESWDLYNSMD